MNKKSSQVLTLLKNLPERNIEILEKRFGLNSFKEKTLEEIGKEYKITRERVRQIIEHSLDLLRKTDYLKIFKDFYQTVKEILLKHGGFIEKENLFLKIASDKRFKDLTSNEVNFLLVLNEEFKTERENQKINSFFYLSSLNSQEVLKKIKKVEQFLKEQKKPVTLDELYIWAKNSLNPNIQREEILSLLTISKKILMNPFGEFGLKEWPEINPVGSSDRAYTLLNHLNRPIHFKELAKILDEYRNYPFLPKLESKFWQKKVCVQTVHNELIKDKRFVLVGRGLYALEKWGYQKNNIKELIKNILFFAQKPLDQETIINEVKKRKFVKERTILLNLSDKKSFKKFPDNTYFLTEEVFKKLMKHPPKPEIAPPNLLEG